MYVPAPHVGVSSQENMDNKAVLERITQREWFHSIDLGDGIVTPGKVPLNYLRSILDYVQVPERLDGLTVLDVGAYDGFFSFEAERRGAKRVVAVDVLPANCMGFALAREVLGSDVEYHHMSAYNLDVQKLGGPFDIVLFLGVYYHLRYPLLALDQICNITRGQLLMETHITDGHFTLGDGSAVRLADIDPRLTRVPLYRFYRLNELSADDYSNWFGPNVEAVLQSLQSAGFDPELLATWTPQGRTACGDGLRAAFRGVKVEGLQEYRCGSYEGTSVEYLPDGTWKVNWHPPRV